MRSEGDTTNRQLPSLRQIWPSAVQDLTTYLSPDECLIKQFPKWCSDGYHAVVETEPCVDGVVEDIPDGDHCLYVWHRVRVPSKGWGKCRGWGEGSGCDNSCGYTGGVPSLDTSPQDHMLIMAAAGFVFVVCVAISCFYAHRVGERIISGHAAAGRGFFSVLSTPTAPRTPPRPRPQQQDAQAG